MELFFCYDYPMAEELIDVFDDQGKPTGEQKLKSVVHRDGTRHKTVHVWIMNSNGELLIQLRAPKKENNPSKWDISAAGHISAGENSLKAAVRETQEELGIAIEEKDLEYLFTIDAPRYVINDGTFIDHEFQDVYLLRLKSYSPKFELQQEEVAEVKWIPWKDLEKRDETFVRHTQEYEQLLAYLKSKAGPKR